MKYEEKEDKRIYILSKEKPVKAVIKLGVPLIAGIQYEEILINNKARIGISAYADLFLYLHRSISSYPALFFWQ